MKVTFTIDTSNEDEFYQLQLFQRARRFYLALSDLQTQTREWVKHDNRSSIPAEEVRETFIRILGENNLSLDDIL